MIEGQAGLSAHPGLPLWLLAALGLLALLLIVLVVVLLARRGQQKKPRRLLMSSQYRNSLQLPRQDSHRLPSSPVGASYCGDCSQPLVPGKKFCIHCGQPVKTDSSRAQRTHGKCFAPGTPAGQVQGLPTLRHHETAVYCRIEKMVIT